MSEQKHTPWFHSSVKPARIGVYQVDCYWDVTRQYYSYFDGSGWRGSWLTPERAVEMGDQSHGFQGSKWRGLSKATGQS